MKKKNRRRALRTEQPELGKLSVPAPQPSDWRLHAWRLVAVWVIALAAYSNSFRSGLVLDSAIQIGQDARIRAMTPQNIDLILGEDFWYKTTNSGLYRPFTTFSYLVNYAVFGNGNRPAGYHWVNFGIHAVNIMLVYLLGLLVLQEMNAAWALTALWALHPLLTESVTYIVGRADLLAGFGVLAGLCCHVQAGRCAGRRRLGWLAGVGAAAFIGISSKESAAVLPALMFLYDITATRAGRWKERWIGYAALIPPFAVYFKLRADVLAREFAGVIPFPDNPLTGADFLTARLTAIRVIGKYLWAFVWPSRLSADYSYNAVPLFGWRLSRWDDLAAILALLICLAAAGIAIYSYRRAKPVFFFVFFFFVALAPVANVVILIGTIMAERFLYLPSVGLAGCLVLVLRFAGRRLAPAAGNPRRVAWAAMILLCGAFATRTFFRNFDWTDESRLGASAVAAVPGSFKTHELLAASRLNARPPDLDGAAGEMERALAILGGLPDNRLIPRPFEVAGLAFRRKGDSVGGSGKDPDSAAAVWYRKALAALLRGQEADRAEKQQIRKANLDTGKNADATVWPPLFLELARTYRRLAEPRKALDLLEEARSRRPDEEFSEELSLTWLALGDPDRAAVALMEGLVLNPSSPKLPADLVRLYGKLAPNSCAVQSGAAGLNLGCPLVRTALCNASRNVGLSFARYGQPAKADATFRSAIRDLGCPAALFR
ncbi:MAG TPA: hypothetical protein VKT49_25735 [Bryobacteraceae bacterium]|nr:hypothetical protein [Bryobacteraceae bacterium]